MPSQFHRFLESLESRTLLHAGDIDPAFNSGQLQTTTFPSSSASASVVDPLPDGSFLVGGVIYQKSRADDQTKGDYQQAGIGIAKYNFDGTLDTTFGDSGEITGTPRGLFYLQQIVNTPDGGFLLLGYTTDSTSLLIKYTAAGQIDTTFGKNGKLIPDSFTQTGSQIAVDSAGRILVPGEINYDAVLRRYLPNGTLDTTFGTNGDYIEDPNPHSKGFDFHERLFTSASLTPDGYIVVTGDENIDQIDPDADNTASIISSTPIVREVTRNGTPVKPFDANTATDNFSVNGFETVAGVSATGNIVLTGDQLMELKSDGTLNTFFGVNGVAGIATNTYAPVSIAVAQDGSIIVPLPASDNAGLNHEFVLRRVLPSGKLDRNFGTNGKLLLASTTDYGIDFKIAVAMAPDGTVITASQAGGVSPSGKVDTRQFEIARVLTGNGPAVQLIPTATKSSPSSRNVNLLVRATDGIDTSTLDNNDLRFVDSQNVFHKMDFVGSTPIAGNDYIQATYAISAPPIALPGYPPQGWTTLQGTYQIRLAGSQIEDLLNNPAEAQILGTVTLDIPPAA